MTPLAIVDYGFIVAFFVGLAVLVLIIAGPRSQTGEASESTVPSQEKTATFSLLTLLFVLLIILAFFNEKSHLSVKSS